MKITTQNYSVIKGGQKKPFTRVRFSIALQDDDGLPLFTWAGWTIDEYRTIREPGARVMFNDRIVSFTHVSKRFQEQLAAAIESRPDVVRILGPRKKKAAEIAKEKRDAAKLDGPEVTVVEGKWS